MTAVLSYMKAHGKREGGGGRISKRHSGLVSATRALPHWYPFLLTSYTHTTLSFSSIHPPCYNKDTKLGVGSDAGIIASFTNKFASSHNLAHWKTWKC